MRIAQCSETILNMIFMFMSFLVRILVFELWSILYFTIVVHSEIRQIHPTPAP